MGQPMPPGDNVPLFEGLDASWNDVVSAIPEDQRALLAPRIKERIDAYEPLKQWEDFQKSGVSPDDAATALKVYEVIENDPRRIYEALGNHLGVSAKEAKEVVEEIQENGSDSELAALKQQVETLAQIELAKHQQSVAAQQAEEQDKALNRELDGLKKKYSDVDEEEILMRMLHKNLTAEQAYQEYSGKVSALRKSVPAPRLIGQGGAVPHNAIDPTKLDSKGTKDLVAQMMQRAIAEKNQ